MAKLPKSIKVQGKRYLIEEGDLEGLAGWCLNLQCMIAVEANQHIDQKADSLLHEALHAVDYNLNLKLTERQVHAGASGILSLLRDNPALVAYLTGK